jgi:hypothetical protein
MDIIYPYNNPYRLYRIEEGKEPQVFTKSKYVDWDKIYPNYGYLDMTETTIELKEERETKKEKRNFVIKLIIAIGLAGGAILIFRNIK